MTSVLGTILHFCKDCFGRISSNVEAAIFSWLCDTLDIRQDHLWKVKNLQVVPRVLQALEIRTGRVVWDHEANTQTHNFVPWGMHRLPCKSCVIRFLSFLSITHYVDVPCNMQHLVIVGPVAAITELIAVSNRLSSNQPVQTADLHALRCALGMEDRCITRADTVCLRLEKKIMGIGLLSVACLVLFRTPCASYLKVFLIVGVFICCMVWWRLDKYRSGASVFLRRTSCVNVLTDMSQETPLLDHDTADSTPEHGSASVTESEDVETLSHICSREEGMKFGSDMNTVVVSERMATNLLENEISYVLLAEKAEHFQSAKTCKAILSSTRDLCFDDCLKCYGVELDETCSKNRVLDVISRIDLHPNMALHVLVHNPVQDVALTVLCDDLTSGSQQRNCVLLIWPPLEALDDYFKSPQAMVSRVSMRTLCDMQAALFKMSAGTLPAMIIVMPVSSEPNCATWRSIQICLGHNNCEFVPALKRLQTTFE